MLDTALKQQLQGYLQHLKNPVELITVSDDSAKSIELTTLAQEIAALSNKVRIVAASEHHAHERRPTLIVRSAETGRELRFAGIPMGHEFTSLVLALLHSGGHPMKLDEDVIEQIRHLKGEYNFETYISLSCQNCPDVVQALNMMAVINPNIHHIMIDGGLNQEEVTQRNIMAVPSVYLNGENFSQGRTTLAEILAKLDTGAAERHAESLNAKEAYDMLVVGAGPAGSAAAIYTARKGLRTGLVTTRFGGQVGDTLAIENFISVKETEGPKLVAQLEEHVREYDVDIMSNQSVTDVIAAKQIGGLIEVTLENGATLKSRSVLLATGARWREMNVPGEQEYRNKGVAYCPHCDGPLFKGKRVAVIGGGNSGIEAAIDLAGIVEHVTVLEFSDVLRADDVLQKKARSMGNIDIIMQAQTTEVIGDGQRVTGLNYIDRISGETKQVELAGIFVQIGLVPNTEFLKPLEGHESHTIDLTSRGEIVVGRRGETNLPGVFAAGDVTDSPYKQIIIAMGDGANAALGAFDYLIRTPEPEAL